MIIKHKYLYYKTLNGFQNALLNGYISHESIVFIEDRLLIWTHGIFFANPKIHADDELSTTSENVVQNKVITAALNDKVDTSQLQYYSKIEDFYKLEDEINTKINKQKGYFSSQGALLETVPNPEVGDWAIVQDGNRTLIYQCSTAGFWENTGQTYDTTIDLSEYVKAKYLLNYIKKEDALEKLVSGVNIKTVNGKTLLGGGNIIVGLDSISEDGMKHRFVTQDEYDSSPEHSADTIYFVYDESVKSVWTLGDKLPIILS